MDVAKRLDFDPTDTLPGLQDASQQLQSANMAALHDLQQCVCVRQQTHATLLLLLALGVGRALLRKMT